MQFRVYQKPLEIRKKEDSAEDQIQPLWLEPSSSSIVTALVISTGISLKNRCQVANLCHNLSAWTNIKHADPEEGVT